MAAIEGLVEYLLFFKRQPSVRQSAQVHPRDPLIAEYFEQWLNAMVYELFFPEEVTQRTANFSLYFLRPVYHPFQT